MCVNRLIQQSYFIIHVQQWLLLTLVKTMSLCQNLDSFWWFDFYFWNVKTQFHKLNGMNVSGILKCKIGFWCFIFLFFFFRFGFLLSTFSVEPNSTTSREKHHTNHTPNYLITVRFLLLFRFHQFDLLANRILVYRVIRFSFSFLPCTV